MGMPTVIRSGEGERFWLINDLVTPLATGDMSGDAYETVGAVSPTVGGPPPHIHTCEDELFYVVDGEYEFTFERTTFRGGPGTAVFLPRGKVHTFANVGAKPGR